MTSARSASSRDFFSAAAEGEQLLRDLFAAEGFFLDHLQYLAIVSRSSALMREFCNTSASRLSERLAAKRDAGERIVDLVRDTAARKPTPANLSERTSWRLRSLTC